LYRKYSNETYFLEEQQRQQPESKVLIGKYKAHETFSTIVINSYKSWIELLKTKNSNYLLIQALNELGNWQYSSGNGDDAIKSWKEAIGIFSEEIKESEENIAKKIGSQQCLLLGSIAWKLRENEYCKSGLDY